MVLELVGAPGETSTRTMSSSLAPDADAGGEVVLQEILTDSRQSVWPIGAFPVSILLTRIHDFAAIVFIAVAAMLPIVDPLGDTPIYLAMISGLMPPERARMAKLVALNSFLLLLASMLTGAYVLHFFGISIRRCRSPEASWCARSPGHCSTARAHQRPPLAPTRQPERA